jgi:hypothetical protein
LEDAPGPTPDRDRQRRAECDARGDRDGAFSSAELDAPILPSCAALERALRGGDIAGALRYVAARRRDTLSRTLSVRLSQIDQVLGDLRFVTQHGLDREGSLASYAVVFVVDEDGRSS